ncbi:MAG: hypothetical protein PHU59_03405 [Candidatus Omnitrophica bacterium]|jgi:hypothetical protein|nr:hypothetical protein [Candidatus Omnitrophota bacterium]
MGKKLKFKPVITQVKLNPEQAVLACSCHDLGRLGSEGNQFRTPMLNCESQGKGWWTNPRWVSSATSS